ncbi:hypothetical protein GCM10011577_40420 [Pseudarthrobacter polychromogenes]|uniref:DUF4012 domain-containing protein n=2 Tax=Pseudarthrobacter polychromogenes TaxID=1676 RepID=A0ABQ1Y4C1_9MICC|nr:hypothetical protein GCM10011577_40420 [Pseudarthrobacter polychromogenes]
MEAAANLVSQLKQEIEVSDADSASSTVSELRQHASAAREASEDPLWTLFAGLPWVGPNLGALAEVARSADDVAGLGLTPLVNVYGSLDWNSLLPSNGGTSLETLKSAAPSVAASAYAVQASSDRLAAIDSDALLPQIADPLTEAAEQLKQATGALNSAADASMIAPGMLGTDGPRNYLLMIQNNAEVRASGGIPGALAVLGFDRGKLSLGDQSSAGDIGIMSPTLPVDPQQQQIYSTRLGKYMQDVNLTPDFPTAAATAQAMWEKRTGQHVDGVISIDPLVLSYILQATGPVPLDGLELAAAEAAGLPTELAGSNVVSTVLSDVYAKIPQPKMQDAYFAGVAKKIFAALSNGTGEGKAIISGISKGTEEGRILVWSGNTSEQSVLAKYPLSGSIAGPSVPAAQFGVYFNDGTGAKMDYYVKRSVQLIKECPKDGYEQTTVRITSTNTAPTDAATSLPAYVTGAGNFGVPPGSVQTNIVAYGPVQAHVETAKVDGQKTEFAPYFHSNRPVGVLAIRLAPGESRTVDFAFGKIVQHTEPNVVVTPTVQDVKDVTLPTETVACG